MIDAPLALYQCTVPQDWLDYNGHMTESCYLLLVGNAADAFFRYVGIDEAYRAAGHSLYTAETHLHHLREASLGDRLGATLQVLDVGPKSLHLFHTMRDEATGEQVATAEQLLVHVDMPSGQVVPMPPDLHGRVTAIRAAHAVLPRPPAVGHAMGIRRPGGRRRPGDGGPGPNGPDAASEE
jgi:carnitine 3-dehydrogenase